VEQEVEDEDAAKKRHQGQERAPGERVAHARADDQPQIE